jgi:S-adenosylmethionine:tRNA ribosyltransferase-isomerase
MKVDAFDFVLPEERIALRPAMPRDSARLLVVYPDGRVEHTQVRELPAFLNAGDALVVNDTRVIPARLHGQRLRQTGPAKIEILLHKRLGPDRYLVLVRPARKLAAGDVLVFGALGASVIMRRPNGEAEIMFSVSGAQLDAAIAAAGEMPLPPYITGKRRVDARDFADYQTVFARIDGSVAAPTASLHFTPELLAAMDAKGVRRETLTLHVGPGTFLPVMVRDTAEHRMHAERAELTPATAARLNSIRAAGGRIVAAGTTSLRTLESAAEPNGTIAPLARETDIFITPGYRFRAVDVLLTNFHLPRSTLFMLVSAFMGLELMQSVYIQAVARRYRFYSYGDACLLFRPQ